MSFYGYNFQYNGKPSEEFGLFISSIDASDVMLSSASIPVEIISQKIYRRAAPYFYGATPSDILMFTMSAHSDDEIDAVAAGAIQRSDPGAAPPFRIPGWRRPPSSVPPMRR